MLDFNHRPTLSEQISAAIDAALQAERAVQTPRDYLGAAPGRALLAPGQATQLAFDILEPGPGVVAFDFRFE